MKRGVIEKLFFVSILLVFLSSGVFALDYGTCNITARSACVSSQGNYIIMGLSSLTNAHGQAFPNTDYPYVICCAFGTGNSTCIGTPPTNKIIGLSSLTNAHAEAPSQTNYQTVNVCYEDLQCISSNVSCGTIGSAAESYKLNFTSLSSITNAHIGGINDYPIKICCKSAKYLSQCTLKSASWNTQSAIDGQRVYLQVVGSGLECDSSSLSFEIKGGYTPVEANATSVAFNGANATSAWIAEWQDGGLLRGDPQFYFNATLVGNPIKSIVSSSSLELTVKKTQIVDYCADITSCSDYSTEDKCIADSSLCNVTKDSSLPGVDCSAPNIFCGCSWNNQSNPPCGFGYSEITSPLCDSNYTLCQDSSTGINYCYPGSSCPAVSAGGSVTGITLTNGGSGYTSTPTVTITGGGGNGATATAVVAGSTGGIAPSNNDGICGVGDSCASSDCMNADQGKQGSCVSGATCLSGKCYSPTAVPKNVTCNYGFTLCRVSGINYCYPGNQCPSGQNPISNGNGKCELGEGCLSADCKDGSQDSCSNETYCMLGRCASVEDPITLIGFGGCKISQTIEKNCDVEPVGYKIISWTGTWTGTDTSGDAYNRCIAGGRSNVPCPAQVQLPFFSYYGIAITLVVIALIYFFLIFRKKKTSKRRKKQKR
jgi:hypothetical protein